MKVLSSQSYPPRPQPTMPIGSMACWGMSCSVFVESLVVLELVLPAEKTRGLGTVQSLVKPPTAGVAQRHNTLVVSIIKQAQS